MPDDTEIERARWRIADDESPLTSDLARSLVEPLGLPLLTADPAVEGGLRALFVWIEDDSAGRPDEVYLWANRLTDKQRTAAGMMRRRPASSIWFTELSVPPDIVVAYRLYPFGAADSSPDLHPRELKRHALSDPFNESTRAGSPFGSVLIGPAAPSLTAWVDPAPCTAVIDSDTVTVHGVDVRHRLIAPREPVADSSVDLLVVFDANEWVDQYRLPDVLACHRASASTSYVLAIDSPADPAERARLLGANEAVLNHIATVLIPKARSTLNDAHAENPQVRIVGQSLGGLSAIVLACWHPDSVDEVLAYSPSVWWRPGLLTRPADVSAREQWIHDQVVGSRTEGFALRLAAGVFEDELKVTVADLAATARDAGYTTSFDLFPSGHDAAAWATQLLTDLARTDR